MALFGSSKSSAFSTVNTSTSTNVEDSRATDVQGSIVATGGGSNIERQVIPTEALEAITNLAAGSITATQQTAADSRAAEAQALRLAFEQRERETETTTQALKELRPLMLGALFVLGLYLTGRR